jgi:hypothetical protein
MEIEENQLLPQSLVFWEHTHVPQEVPSSCMGHNLHLGEAIVVAVEVGN